MPTNDRPKVGPADPETRRKKLRELLDTPSKATGVAPKSMKEAVDAGVKQGSDKLPNGEKRRANQPAKPKKKLVRRWGPEGKTEEEMGL
jgi:hypothetical protein